MDLYTVVFACPNTGKATPTGHEISDLAAFTFIGLARESCRCQHCHEFHVWHHDQAWLTRREGSRIRLPALQPPPRCAD
jgi:hypothetical protein